MASLLQCVDSMPRKSAQGMRASHLVMNKAVVPIVHLMCMALNVAHARTLCSFVLASRLSCKPGRWQGLGQLPTTQPPSLPPNKHASVLSLEASS